MRLPSYERLRVILLLRRFFRTSLLLGRMPSVMGGDRFRSQFRSRPSRAFEDAVLFVCDVERCLRSLEPFDQRILALCIFEDRSEWETARLFGRPQAHISRRLGEVLDLLHETFCRLGLLTPPPAEVRPTSQPARPAKLERTRNQEVARPPQPSLSGKRTARAGCAPVSADVGVEVSRRSRSS
ncbi:MAG: hypothetical protein K6U09_06730 [Acidobacteriia bacterium]|jgi:hypothetical protein|nr:hypothetical protein [Terriglobia bacterium]